MIRSSGKKRGNCSSFMILVVLMLAPVQGSWANEGAGEEDLFVSSKDWKAATGGAFCVAGSLVTQADVDALAGCTVIDDNLRIGGALDLDLTPLGSITHITQDLSISNPGLTSLDGLHNLVTVGGTVWFDGNQVLASLQGLDSLATIGGNLLIGLFHGAYLETLDGLSNLTSIGASLLIRDCSDLNSIDGLRSLETIDGHLSIYQNPVLTTFDGLQNLAQITGDLSITNNDVLADISALGNLTSVGGLSRILDNRSLECSQFDLPIFPIIDSGGNLHNCPGIWRGSWILRTQEEVDALKGCHGVGGNLGIAPSTTELDLTPLQDIKSIRGSLWISSNFAGTDLKPLQNIESIGGDLVIYDHLASLPPFRNIESIGGSLTIQANPADLDLTPLRSIALIGRNLTIRDNVALSSLHGLEGITQVQGEVRISENQGLTTLRGLRGLTTIEEELTIQMNESLVDISALGNLTSVGFTRIESNPALPCWWFQLPFFPVGRTFGNLVDCNGPPTGQCQGSFTLSDQADVNALSACAVIDGDLTIGPSDLDLDLSPLESLLVVVGDFIVVDNPHRTSLDGLHALASVFGNLNIEGNDSLVDLGALESLVHVAGITTVRNNPSLDCTLSAPPFFPVDISENNSVDCLTTSVIVDLDSEHIPFGSQSIHDGPTESASATLTNVGSEELVFRWGGIDRTGPHAGEFSVVNHPTTTPVAPGESRQIEIAFDPVTVGVKTANLTLFTNSWDRPVANIAFSGTGVDPHFRKPTSPNEAPSGLFGSAVAGFPGATGEGRDNVIIGAYGENGGRVYIYDASEERLLYTLVSPSTGANCWFGFSIAGAPNVNDEGVGYVIVGAPREDGSKGRAYIFEGSAGLLVRTLTSPHNGESAEFGTSVASLPDINGDGYEEVAVGAPDPRGHEGRAYIYDGSSGALIHEIASPTFPHFEVGRFGVSVSGVSDANGDGRGDVIVGAPKEDPGGSPRDAGRAYLFDGSTGALLHEFVSPNEAMNGDFGVTVSAVPDANGDGRGDVVVGAPNEISKSGLAESGNAYIFDGSTGALLFTLASPNKEPEGHFGCSVSGIADVDGDGAGDVVIGAKDESPASIPARAGRAYVFSGATGRLLRTLNSFHEETDGQFGSAVAGILDANGDGLGDVVIGALAEDPGNSPEDAGRAYVFLSTSSDIEVSPLALSFGEKDVQYGPTASQPVALQNQGEAVLQFIGPGLSIVGEDADDFVIAQGMPPYPLVRGMSEEIEIAFDPASTGPKSASLRIATNDPKKRIVDVFLEGVGTIVSADFAGDSRIDPVDLIEFLAQYRNQEAGVRKGPADLNGDGSIDDRDLFLFADQWDRSRIGE